MRRSRGRAHRRGRRALVVALVVVATATAAWYAARPGPIRDAVEERVAEARLARYAPHFVSAGEEFGLDPHLIAAVCWVESSARARAESPAGALGLMQLKLGTASDMARRLGMAEPTREQLLDDPALNVRLGAAYLHWLLPRQGGDVDRALMAYNTGPARFDRWLAEAGGYAEWRARVDASGPPPRGGVRWYAARVTALAREFRERDALGAQTGPYALR